MQTVVNNLCFTWERLRDLVEESELGENVYFIHPEHNTVWRARRLDHCIHIVVIRDYSEIYEVLGNFCPALRGLRK